MRHTVALFILACFSLFSTKVLAFSAQTDGLAGAGRGGIPKEALFSNPAAVGLLSGNTALVNYTLTRMPDYNSKGKVQVVGIYDGSSQLAHGGLAYIRESRRTAIGEGSTYADQTIIRGVFGRPVWQNLVVGGKINYTTHRVNNVATKYFHGDLGLIYPLFADMPIGITVENISNRDLERPRSIFAGIKYALGPLGLYLDGGKVVSGSLAKRDVWSIAAELQIFSEIVLRAGLFRDSVTSTRGYSLGASWFGPRTAFEYALKTTSYSPVEMNHVFGISFVF